jgi:hypothetical protein
VYYLLYFERSFQHYQKQSKAAMKPLKLFGAASGKQKAIHVNKVYFEGCLTFLDVASNKAPSGARGHKIILTEQAAKDSLPDLLGMSINYKSDWDGHNNKQKWGIITGASIEDKKILVEGFIYALDCIDTLLDFKKIGAEKFGMSYELEDARVIDMREAEWRLSRVTFRGAAVLLKEKAAYSKTYFKLIDPVKEVKKGIT